MRLINVLNGDCALAEWRKSGMPGETLVWRENYLQGKLPGTGDLTEFNRIRAAELHQIAPDKVEDVIFAELESMNRTLLELRPEDRVVLWFDVCPFDRLILSRILYILALMREPPSVGLILRDVVWSRETFSDCRDKAEELKTADFKRGAEQWHTRCRQIRL